MGITDAGIFGDILCARMSKRKVAALVSDGVVRDLAGVLGTGLPVWCQGTAAPASVAGLTFVGWQEPIGCGGVAVMPNDVIVADGDGAVVIPAALLDEVLESALEQERLEGWIMREVEAGVPLPGLYPSNDATKARYEAWRATQPNVDALSGESQRAQRGGAPGGARDPVPEHRRRRPGRSRPVQKMPAASEKQRRSRREQRRPAGRAEVRHQPPDAEEVGPADGRRVVGAERHDHSRADAVAEAEHQRRDQQRHGAVAERHQPAGPRP